MKFSESWLRESVNPAVSVDELVAQLTMAGLEVDSLEAAAPALTGVVVGEIVAVEQHPDADKLRVCQVAGQGELAQVVCGAPNARAGITVVLAKPGDYVPGIDVTLSVGKIRGVESHGMMASERELELSDEHDGIIALPDDAPVGARYVNWAGMNDPVFDIAITPNRQECLGILGIARDLAAAGVGTLGIIDDDTVSLSNLQRQVLLQRLDRRVARIGHVAVHARGPVKVRPRARSAANCFIVLEAVVAVHEVVHGPLRACQDTQRTIERFSDGLAHFRVP